MSESHSEIRYFTAEDTDDFITGWYRVSDGERIGERLDLPPPPPLAFSPARTEPVIPSFSGIFSDGVYADPTLGFSPFSPEEDEKVEVKQTVSILNPIIDTADDVFITLEGSTVHRIKVQEGTLFNPAIYIDDPSGAVIKQGTYGSLKFIPDDPGGSSSGEWVYTLFRRNGRVINLAEGQQVEDQFKLVYGDIEELITITITGANDPFVFSQLDGYLFSVTEGVEIGTILGGPSGRDPEGDTTTFSIASGNEDGLFAINPYSGLLTVVGDIDFETTPYISYPLGDFERIDHFYELMVEANDGISPPSQIKIQIHVRDIDDTPPEISSSKTTTSIRAGVPGYVTDIEFSFTDVDTTYGPLQDIRWVISGNQANKFEIYRDPFAWEDGYRLQLKYLRGNDQSYAELDYGRNNELHLTVRGIDSKGNVSEPLSIIVHITPPNLHTPILTVMGKGAITEKLAGQDTGVTFTITDLDEDDINQFSFIIHDSHADLFEIVDVGGIWTLRAKSGVSFDARDFGTINVRVSVSDGINISIIETIAIDIVAIDEGDATYFTSSQKGIRVAPKVGTLLTPLRGENDPDGHTFSPTKFEWFHVGAPDEIISTARYYTVTESDIGFRIHFRAIYQDDDGLIEVVTANPGSTTGVVTAADNAGSHADQGDATFFVRNTQAREAPTPGSRLVADRGEADPDGHNGRAVFQWFRINAPEVIISREKAYHVTPDDLGHRLNFRAFYVDGDGRIETVLGDPSSITGVVTATSYRNTIVASTKTASITENEEGHITDITLRLRDSSFTYFDLTRKDFIITAHGSISDVDKSNPLDLFEIVNINGQWTLKLKDHVSLNFEEQTSYSFTITIKNIVNGKNVPSNTIIITINVVDVHENAHIQILPPNQAEIDVNDELTVDVISEDDRGLHATPDITYKWFYASNPEIAIGTGDTYRVKETDRGERIGVERTYTDKLNNIEKVVDILDIEVQRVEITSPPQPTPSPSTPSPTIDTTITVAPETATKVMAGDGADTITDGNRNDIIIGGRGDDIIDLGHDQEGNDHDQVIYGIGHQSAKDGGDIITNFNRGHDRFVFSLEANSATDVIHNLDDFLTYVMSGTPDDLHDDQLLVVLNLNINPQGEAELAGLSFHFKDSVSFGDGRIAIPVVKVQFSTALNQQEIIAALGGDMQTALSMVNSDGILTNLDYLDDLMGGDGSIGYQIDVL